MRIPRLVFAFIPVACLLGGDTRIPSPAAVVEAYSELHSSQSDRLRGATMEVEIEASLPKLKKHGRLQALRHISRLGRITYEAIHFEGDTGVKSNVIARYLAADAQAQTNDGSSVSITPANYKFKFKGLFDRDGRQVYVFQLTPRKKRLGLFKGDLWLDAETCLPVRESGRLVKSPSVFVRRIEFVREYEIRDGLAIPAQIASIVDTRLVGKAELTVHFRNVSLAETSGPSLASASGQ